MSEKRLTAKDKFYIKLIPTDRPLRTPIEQESESEEPKLPLVTVKITGPPQQFSEEQISQFTESQKSPVVSLKSLLPSFDNPFLSKRRIVAGIS